MSVKSAYLPRWILAAALAAMTGCGGDSVNAPPVTIESQTVSDAIPVDELPASSGDTDTTIVTDTEIAEDAADDTDSVADTTDGAEPEAGTADDAGTDADEPPIVEEETITGQFLLDGVQGINYTTESQIGTTNVDGQFQYVEGEVVRFYVGRLALGEAAGKPLVSIFDLVDEAEIFTGNALRQAIDKSIPFNRVINTAILLHTLDNDNDLENGIVLDFDVTKLFDAHSVNFNQRWDNFRNDLGLRSALAEAKSSGAVENTRQIRKPWRALKRVYQELGVEVLLRPDRRILEGYEVFELEYDSEGKLLQNEMREEWYLDGPALIGTYAEYDEFGNQTAVETRLWIDYNLVLSAIFTYQYDSDGNLIETISGLTGEDGDIEAFGTATHDYNEFGQHLSMLTLSNIDETANNSISYEYDSTGALIRQVDDTDNDGVANNATTFGYDPYGRIILEQKDSDLDGDADLITTTLYDQPGNVVRIDVIYDGGGQISQVSSEINFFDIDGNLELKELYSDGNAQPDTTHQYEYDTNGNLTLEESFSSDERYQSHAYEYDSNDNLITHYVDEDGDGVTDETIIHEIADDVDPWWSLFPGASNGEYIDVGSINGWILFLLGGVGVIRLSRRRESS